MKTYTPPLECKVIGVEISETMNDIGAAAAKALPPGRRVRYSREAIYKLDNGDSVKSQISGATKPKLQERVESTKNNVNLGCMFATQYDHGDGPYWSLATRYYIGPR